MIGLISLAAAFPLDIPRDEHLAELRACDDGDADACMRLANASGRAFVASIAAHARGTASFDLQRNAEMSMFVQAACAAGSLEACHLADDPAGACGLKDPEGCTELLGDGPAVALFTCVGPCDTPCWAPSTAGTSRTAWSRPRPAR